MYLDGGGSSNHREMWAWGWSSAPVQAESADPAFLLLIPHPQHRYKGRNTHIFFRSCYVPDEYRAGVSDVTSIPTNSKRLEFCLHITLSPR